MKVLVAIFALLAVALSDVGVGKEPIPIIKQNSELNVDGSYQHSYQTGNGIAVQEQGYLKNAGNPETETAEVVGEFRYPGGVNGAELIIQYIANENGFIATGAHLPTPPPVPELPNYIVRALEWIKDHPEPEDSKREY